MSKPKINSEDAICRMDDLKCYLTDGIREWPIYDKSQLGDIEVYRTDMKLVTTNRALLFEVNSKIDKKYEFQRNYAPQHTKKVARVKCGTPRTINEDDSEDISPLHIDAPIIHGSPLSLSWADFELESYMYNKLFR